MLVAFLAAYMSTVSTQLNWGSSYMVNDFFKRFIKPESKYKTKDIAEKNYVRWSRLFTIFIMFISVIVTTQIETISGVWNFVLECGAGLGLVLILRWYWWRINAWSEITATVTPFIAYAIGHYYLEPLLGENFIVNKGAYLFTVITTTILWIIVTFLTKPTNDNTLINFYNKIKPDGAWERIRILSGLQGKKSNLSILFLCWLMAIIMTYSILFAIGKMIFLDYLSSVIYFFVAIVTGIILFVAIRKTNILN